MIVTLLTAAPTVIEILEPDLNFSDHLPISVSVACSISTERKNTSASRVSSPDQLHLRWDKADLNLYYFYTGHYLQPYFSQLEDAVNSCDNISPEMIDTLYNNIISVLISGATLYVLVHQKFFFYKYRWDQELSAPKEAAVNLNKLWKIAGKPRQGPLFDKRQLCRARYRNGTL